MKITKRHLVRSTAAALVAMLPALSVLAQAQWPSQPIKLIVPFTAGGATDQVARLMASKISTSLGTTVIVDNRPGANGNIGADLVAKAAPDGYTFLHTTSAIAFTAAFKQKVSYDLGKDLKPVSLVINQPLLIVSSLQSGIVDAASLREFLRKNGGRVSTPPPGTGT